MRNFLLIAALALPLALCGCSQKPTEAAPNGAPPPVEIPVGPIPGPAKAMNLPQNPYVGDMVALQQGRKLFVQYNCAGCHGGHGGGGMGPSLRDKDWIYGSSDAHIFDSIAHGRAHGMPAWGTRIPEQQVWKLAAYIKSMRTPQEPDPPVPQVEPKAVLK